MSLNGKPLRQIEYIQKKILLVANPNSQIVFLLPAAITVSTLGQFEDALRVCWDAVVLTNELLELSPEMALQLIAKQQPSLPAIVVATALTTERTMGLVHLGAADCLDFARSETLPAAIEAAMAATHLTIAIRQSEWEMFAKERQAPAERDRLLVVAELEKLVQLKDDFLSTVSHELRTPVTNMRVAIHMLQQTTDEKRRSQYLNILESECSREICLVNNLLDLQRLDTYPCLLELEQVELDLWLPIITAPFFNRAHECEQTLVVQVLPTLLAICTERASFEQIVIELLNNACKYTPANEQISIGLKPVGNHLELTVANTGVEIPPAELLRIFEKFYRIPNCDPWRKGGTGLGLALVQHVTQRLGGEIWVKSEHCTTTFTVALPFDLSLNYCEIPKDSLELEVGSHP